MKKDPLKYFTERIGYWIDFFGLYFWDVNVYREDDGHDESLAYTLFDVYNKRTDIYLVMNWGGGEMSEYELDKTALHEVLEVLVAEIRHLAGRRDIRFEEIDSALHTIIRILTAKIFEKER